MSDVKKWFYLAYESRSSEGGTEELSFVVQSFPVSQTFGSVAELINSLEGVEEVNVETCMDVLRLGKEMTTRYRQAPARTVITNSTFIADLFKLAARDVIDVQFDADVNATYLYFTGATKVSGLVLNQEEGHFVPHPHYSGYVRRLMFN
jgi:hypothetical protein